ncbi:MAG: hypothetical protein CL850_05335, partial [Crocinitomicaceae bacterium]|nr:hypothetical protein [Crocinitomicaceae bacterium]
MELTLDQALQRGVEAQKAGKVQEADRYYTAILKSNPKNPDANHNMGVLALGIGKVEQALPFFKTALEVKPSTAQFWLSYIDALIKLDRLTDAKVIFYQAKENGAKGDKFDKLEQRIRTLSKMGRSQDPPKEQVQPLIDLFTQGKLKETLESVSLLLEDFPRSVSLYNLIGVANKSLGRLEESIEAYNKALSIQPDYVEAYYNKGNVFQKQGKLEEAIAAYNKAILINPRYHEAYSNMGNALQEQSKLDEAIKAYNKALSIQPDYAEAYNNMGGVFQKQGKLEEAIEVYNKALSIQPDYAHAKHMLAALTGNKNKTAPREYVENLFDGYSRKFEASLVDKLGYKVPKLIKDILIKPNGEESLGSVLDLGCGSGLLGQEIREHCAQLEGIDLSSKMLDLAKQKNVYD